MANTRIVIDCKGLHCPEPLLRARHAQREHPGAILEILATDPLAETDIRALAARSGWRVQSCTYRDELCVIELLPPIATH